MKIEFLEELVRDIWKEYGLPGGLSVDIINNEVVIKTDCMIDPKSKHLVQLEV